MKGRMGEGKEGDEKGTDAYVREAFSRIFSQWDVQMSVC